MVRRSGAWAVLSRFFFPYLVDVSINMVHVIVEILTVGELNLAATILAVLAIILADVIILFAILAGCRS